VTMRSIMVGAGLVMSMGVMGYLMANEEVVPPEVTATHVALKADPLLQTRYTEGSRKKNMAAFGLTESMQASAIDRMRRIEQKHARKIQILLNNAPDPNALADALCGQTSLVRPRYAAMRFLIKDNKGRRDPIQISRITGLEEQEWSQVSPIGDVFGKIELSDERQDDATMMAVAAIIEGREQDVLESYAPWGRGLLPGAWSWSKVTDVYPGLSERVVEYFAVMHLFVEYATADDGLCGEDESESG
jgi:hypothetical protein